MPTGGSSAGIRLTLEAKQLFLDREAIVRRLDAAERRYHARAGGLTRSIARRSIGYRKRRSLASPPGKPPYSHRTGRGIRDILFAYEQRRGSTVIGPTMQPGKRDKSTLETLERGGRILVSYTPKTKKRGGKQRGAGGRFKARRKVSPAQARRIREAYGNQPKVTKAFYSKPRPSMGPALEKASPQFASMYQFK